jgi:hypothetical protein
VDAQLVDTMLVHQQLQLQTHWGARNLLMLLFSIFYLFDRFA